MSTEYALLLTLVAGLLGTGVTVALQSDLQRFISCFQSGIGGSPCGDGGGGTVGGAPAGGTGGNASGDTNGQGDAGPAVDPGTGAGTPSPDASSGASLPPCPKISVDADGSVVTGPEPLPSDCDLGD